MRPPTSSSLTYDELLARSDENRLPVWSTSALLAQRTVTIESDDLAIFDDFFAAFGGPPASEGRPADEGFLFAGIRAGEDDCEYGCMRLRREGRPHRVDDVFFGLTFPGCPFESRQTEDGWTEVWLPDEEPLFAYRGDVCLFRKSRSDWRIKLLTLLYRGSLRLRDDLIFFHASALSVSGKGILLLGRRKAGKSTTSLALAARGHAVLADSCACYAPATGELVPFQRPVGIREGPRSHAVDHALSRGIGRSVERDESMRVDLASLLPAQEAGSVPAAAIFFLRGFAPQTRIDALRNDTSELPNLQPIYSSFANAPHTQRAFELIRLLSRARLYALWPGNPDDAARSIEEVMQ